MNDNNNGHAVQEIRRLFGDVVLLQCNGKAPIKKGWRQLTVAEMKPEYLNTLCRSNIGVATGAPSNGLCVIDLDAASEVEPFFARNPRLRNTFRVGGRTGREKIFVRCVGKYPAKRTLVRNGEQFGEWISTGGQAIIWGVHPEGFRYRWINKAAPISLAFTELDFGKLDTPLTTTRSVSTDNTVSTASCEHCITLHPLHNIKRRAAVMAELQLIDERLPALYERFIEPFYLPVAGCRHNTLVKAVEFLCHALSRDRIRILLSSWHKLHAHIFNTERETHMNEFELALTGSLNKYQSALPAEEAELYEQLPDGDRDAFRIMRDLAHRGELPGRFFLSCCELGKRIGKRDSLAQRALQRFEYSYELIKTVKKGTRRALGQRGMATEFEWLLPIPPCIPQFAAKQTRLSQEVASRH